MRIKEVHVDFASSRRVSTDDPRDDDAQGDTVIAHPTVAQALGQRQM